MKIRMPMSEELLDNIDLIIKRFEIKISSYPKAVNEICNILLEKREVEIKQFHYLKTIIENIFKFLQEKVNEKDYISKGFFKDLLKIYDAITNKLAE